MQEVSGKRELAIARLSKTVDKLIQDNSLYQERLDKQEIIQHLVNLLDKFSPEFINALSEGELTDRIDSILVIEAVSGTLNDLTPEQIEMFDAAVKRR
ncbi:MULTISPECIES: hypothetical protein [unclassified Nostoc]|uniref:Uncharacterized protein n=1 Tax=Nostoc punctiforme NIES-2108 TaxID=1356359 RepID=A0A367RFR2_NOSPU|nr:hypothetical protein [Nostoc sp. JL23]MBN3880388.1 hypothetical protein [Nostoc sp. JL23]RCJ34212.1 hypothetical protein A6769_22355 [Nostoc punctiforme NIES-2108]